MAIVAEFSADATTGESPFEVTFTDESTGSPNMWLWDFGDGEFSTDQHPVHTYVGEDGDKFDVKLTAWAYGGDSWLSMGNVSQRLREGGVETSNAAAFAAWVAASWSSTGWSGVSYTRIRKTGTFPDRYAYDSQEEIKNFTIPASATNISILEFNYINRGSNWIGEGQGSQDISSVIMNAADYPVFQSQKLADVSYLQGLGVQTITPDMLSLISASGELATPVNLNDGIGIAGQFRIKEHVSSDTDVEEKLEYITIGEPLVPDFIGAPLEGVNPLAVQFTNLTTPESTEENPITYSWQRRLAGSGDSFVEFSTAEHPLVNFGKE